MLQDEYEGDDDDGSNVSEAVKRRHPHSGDAALKVGELLVLAQTPADLVGGRG